jgi:DNA invertase Pin-like site-specific DNA recombinase
MTAVKTRHLTTSDLRGLRWRGYLRESSQGQADKGTPLDRQRSEIERAAVELGLVPSDPVWYQRVGSGEAERAPELQAALADVARKQYDVLVVFHSSRLARDRVEAGLVKREFTKAGGIIYFVSQRLISGTYTGALAEGMGEVIDSYENETRRMWVAGGLRERQIAGRWVGTVPYGYRWVMADRPDGSRGWDGALEPDPDVAAVVREIFDLAARGEGTGTIASIITAAGHRTSVGLPFRKASVHSILTNPVYAGRLVRYRRRTALHYYDHGSDDGHADLGLRLPAIVSGTLFDQVHRLRSKRRHPTSRKVTYPLSSVLRCAQCGGRMTGCLNSAPRLTRYYRCENRLIKTCDAPYVRADDAEAAFADWLARFRLPDDWRQEVARSTVEGTSVRDRNAALETRLAKLRDLYSWDHISRTEYLRQTAEIKASMAVSTMPSMNGMEAVAGMLRDMAGAWSQADPRVQATWPPLMLKSIEAVDGKVETFVVDASLRPLLELCTDVGEVGDGRPRVHIRFSA